MKYFSSLSCGIFAAIAMLTAAPAVPAATILVDFNKDSTSQVATGWNGITGATNVATASAVAPKISNAIDSHGNLTGVSVFITDGFVSAGVVGISSGTSLISSYPSTATQDGAWIYGGAFGGDQTAALRMTGLDPARLYALTLYGSYPGGISRIMNVTVGDVLRSYNGGGSAGEGMTVFNDVEVSTGGVLDILLQGNASSQYAILSLLQITATGFSEVPEPTTLSLVALGLLGVLGRRRPV